MPIRHIILQFKKPVGQSPNIRPEGSILCYLDPRLFCSLRRATFKFVASVVGLCAHIIIETLKASRLSPEVPRAKLFVTGCLTS